MQSIMAFWRLFMLHGISKLRVLQNRQSFKLFITSLILETPQNWGIYVINPLFVDDGFTLVDIQSLARDLCDLPLWVYDGFTLVDIQSLARDLHDLRFWVYDGFTSVNIQSLARDLCDLPLWVYDGLTLVDILSLCKGFTWPTLVNLWWILPWSTFNLLQLKHQIAFNLHTRFAHFVCYKILWLGFWNDARFTSRSSHTPLKQILPQIWPFGPLGRLDLYGDIMGEYYNNKT
jgi:hypothetical protein